jgi:signal-transduction protein with cAMP-binding, CBS, and nucleotidyltransferase domain
MVVAFFPLPMALKEFIKKTLVTCQPHQTVLEVANLMKDHQIGAILVVNDEGEPKGIVTDRDLVLRCICETHDCTTAPIQNIMTSSVKSVTLSQGLTEVLECMKKASIRRVPLVDEKGKAVALLSFGDVLEFLVKELTLLASTAMPQEKKIDEKAA